MESESDMSVNTTIEMAVEKDTSTPIPNKSTSSLDDSENSDEMTKTVVPTVKKEEKEVEPTKTVKSVEAKVSDLVGELIDEAKEIEKKSIEEQKEKSNETETKKEEKIESSSLVVEEISVNSKEEMPVNSTVDEIPLNLKEEEIPLDLKEEIPFSSKIEKIPLNLKEEEIPLNSKVEEIPVNSKVEEIPVNSKVEEIPLNSKVEEIPVNSKVEEINMKILNRLDENIAGEKEEILFRNRGDASMNDMLNHLLLMPEMKEEEEEEEEFIESDWRDETLFERISALGLIFPKPIRRLNNAITPYIFSTFEMTKVYSALLIWGVATTFAIAAAPAVFEYEYFKNEEQQELQSKRLMLGPAAENKQ
ncbi:hypothetical protein SNEBB_000705 [Seison nebaliae]|nr:hypothetical protein SNEBB_000705 [Seison nebaliae]